MGCEYSNRKDLILWVEPVYVDTLKQKSSTKSYTHVEKITHSQEFQPVDVNKYSFHRIDQLIQQIQDNQRNPSLKKQVRQKSRLLLQLLYNERGQIMKEEKSMNPKKYRVKQIITSLNSALIAQIRATNRALSDIYKMTFDGLCILLQLYIRPVQVSQISISHKLIVEFWRDSFEESGRVLVNPVFDFRGTIRYLAQDGHINGETLELLEPLVREDWFCESVAARISKAVAYLVSWIRNLWEYSQTSKVIERRRKKVEKVERWVTIWMKRNVREVYIEEGLQ